jgi:hypothetical protein
VRRCDRDLAALLVSIFSLLLCLASLWWSRRNYLETRRRLDEAMGRDVRYTLRDELRDVFGPWRR